MYEIECRNDENKYKHYDFLNENNAITMKLLRTESLYICNFALETADRMKKGELKDGNNND